MRINTAKAKLVKGEAAFGYSLKLGSPVAAEFLSQSGADFLSVDTQHGSWEADSFVHAFAAICTGPAVPLARVTFNAFGLIGPLLDAGALGIVVPNVDRRDQAQAAADACRFPPRGTRSYGTGRCLAYGDDYADWIDDQLLVMVQIESVEAVENAEAILSVPGVDGCMVGPADLSLSLGFAPKLWPKRDDHARMLERVVEACRNTGKIPGIDTGSLDTSLVQYHRGYRFLVVSSDQKLLTAAASGTIKQAREAIASEQPWR